MIWRNMFDDQSGAINQLLQVVRLPGNIRWLQQIDPPLSWIPPYVRVPEGAMPYFFLFILILLLIVPVSSSSWVRRALAAVHHRWWIVLELQFFALVYCLLLLRGRIAIR